MHEFSQKLLRWHAQNPRPQPWTGERDPYRIWLSEIILQQTRVEQGRPYFEKFVAAYPTVQHLAAAPEDEILKLWQGLGYYTRARNLHATAKKVAHDLGGKFPETFDGLRQLPGVGDYTAAAIASFAYGLPHAVVDGNVYRVLARHFGIETATDLPAAKREFTQLANELLPALPAEAFGEGGQPSQNVPAAFNQALMDFGATVCTPAQPRCPSCPLQSDCHAHLYNKVSELPRRRPKAAKRRRFFLYLIIQAEGQVLLRQRRGDDIWKNLWEFPLLELAELPADRAAVSEIISNNCFEKIETGWVVENLSEPRCQLLSHQNIVAVFASISLKNKPLSALLTTPALADCICVNQIKAKKMYAVPRLIATWLEENALHLSLF